MPVSALDKIMSSGSNLSPEFQKVFQSSVLAERKPIQTLEDKKQKVEAKTGLLNDVIGKVENIKKILPNMSTAVSLLEVTLSTNDDKIVTGTAEKGKAPLGDFSLEVLQLASPATAVSNGFPDKDETSVGTGYLAIGMPNGETAEIFIDSDNGSLEGLASSINSAAVGVRASVIKDATDPENPFRLLLTGKGSGADSSITYPEFYFVDGEADFYLEKDRPAVNALVRFEGQEFESTGNEIKDVIPGVTLNLRGVSDGRPVTVHIDQDTPKTSAKIKDLVKNLNEVFSFIQKQNQLDANSDSSRTLGGDYAIRVTESRLRESLFHALPADLTRQIRTLGDMGIQFSRQGMLELNEQKLEGALKNGFTDVADVLLGPDNRSGVLPRLSQSLQTLTAPGAGVLSNQKQNLTEQTRRIQKDIDTKEKFIEKKAEALRDKLARAQGALSALQGQANRLAQSLPSGQGI